MVTLYAFQQKQNWINTLLEGESVNTVNFPIYSRHTQDKLGIQLMQRYCHTMIKHVLSAGRLPGPSRASPESHLNVTTAKKLDSVISTYYQPSDKKGKLEVFF
jgi:hypothetical protein